MYKEKWKGILTPWVLLIKVLNAISIIFFFFCVPCGVLKLQLFWLRQSLWSCGVPQETRTVLETEPPSLAIGFPASVPYRLDRSVGGGRRPAHQLRMGTGLCAIIRFCRGELAVHNVQSWAWTFRPAVPVSWLQERLFPSCSISFHLLLNKVNSSFFCSA